MNKIFYGFLYVDLEATLLPCRQDSILSLLMVHTRHYQKNDSPCLACFNNIEFDYISIWNSY